MSPKWEFSPFVTPQDFFFKNRTLSLLYPYGALTSCKKLEKLITKDPVVVDTAVQKVEIMNVLWDIQRLNNFPIKIERIMQ